MTEDEWLNRTYAPDMLRHLRRTLPRERIGDRPGAGYRVFAPERKLRLFAVAVCNKLRWLFKHDWHRFALDMLEEAAEFADDPETRQERGVVRSLRELQSELDVPTHEDNPDLDLALSRTIRPHELWEGLDGQLYAVQRALEKAWGNRKPPFSHDGEYLLCIIGNPFRPVAFAPSWRTETAVALAAGIYADRAFDRLPILADALEEAGCDNADVLNHCRGPGPHARGCWVVDGVLGKV
jgi:hypothetical protein